MKQVQLQGNVKAGGIKNNDKFKITNFENFHKTKRALEKKWCHNSN